MNRDLQALVDFCNQQTDRFFHVDYAGHSGRWEVNVFLGVGWTCPGVKTVRRGLHDGGPGTDRWVQVQAATYEAAVMKAAQKMGAVRPLAVAGV